MRVSVLKEDPGYQEDSKLYTVFIDGVLNKHCLTADTETGEALVEVTDKDGNVVLTEEGNSIKYEIITGGIKFQYAGEWCEENDPK